MARDPGTCHTSVVILALYFGCEKEENLCVYGVQMQYPVTVKPPAHPVQCSVRLSDIAKRGGAPIKDEILEHIKTKHP